MSQKRTVDNAKYHKLNQPLDKETVNANIEKFGEELSEIREKYNIPDLFIVVRGSVQYEDKVSEYLTATSMGDSLKAIALAAFGYGQAKADHRELINKLAD